jgi:hypothetical protein
MVRPGAGNGNFCPGLPGLLTGSPPPEQRGFVHVGLMVLPGDPVRLGGAVHFLEHEGRPAAEGEEGCLGMAVSENAELGVAVAEWFWASGEALCRAERVLAPVRAEAARLAVATESIEQFLVGAYVRAGRPHPGAGVRLTRFDTDPSRLDDAVAAYEGRAAPALRDTDGFCIGMLCVDRRTGRAVGESVWRDANALAASRSAAAVLRRDTMTASATLVRAVEEYRLVFSSVSVRPASPATAPAAPREPAGTPPVPPRP